MAYSDSDDEFLDMYSDEENQELTPGNTGYTDLGSFFAPKQNKCNSCGNTSFNRINGVLV